MRPGSPAMICGTGALVPRANNIAGSCSKNGGTCFSHTSPMSVGIFQIDERFQVRTCTGSSVIVTWLAAHARSAPGPPGRAYGKRSGSS